MYGYLRALLRRRYPTPGMVTERVRTERGTLFKRQAHFRVKMNAIYINMDTSFERSSGAERVAITVRE